MKNTIKLDEDETLQFEITDSKGNPTGEYLEFNMDDISLPLKYRDVMMKDKANRDWYKKELIIINKRQDSQEKGDPLTKNQIDILKTNEEFFKKEADIYNIFLGENGVQKLLNGRPLGWESLEKIGKLITEQIVPTLDKHTKSMEDMIKAKYGPGNDETELL